MAMAKELGCCAYFACSAKDNHGVQELFAFAVNAVLCWRWSLGKDNKCVVQ
jgi:hypothetical protein